MVSVERRRLAKITGSTLFYIVLFLGMAFMAIPFIWMFSVSVGPAGNVFSLPPHWIPWPIDLSAYLRVLTTLPFVQWFLNSLKVAGLITIGQLFTCSTAAYAFARLHFPGRDVLFGVLLASLMIPVQVTIIPIFILMRMAHLVDNHASLILPPLVSAFGVFLLRQFFLTVPQDLEDAAKMDGANPFVIYWQVMLPLAGGALATLAVLTFNFFWNDFFTPLIFINTPWKMTLPLAVGLMAGRYRGPGGLGADPAGIVAAVSLSILPVLILFLFAQRYLIESITMTGLKD